MQPRYASFFSGALGLDLGLEQAGLECAVANELDRWAVETIRKNRPALPLLDRDIRGVTVDDIRALAPGPLFAVVGGPPCQAFSTAGRRKGLADERGNVFLRFLDLAIGLGPRYIVIENVRGLLSAASEPQALRGSALRQVLETLHGGGYGVSFQLYNTANFGVPQTRERVILIAGREGETVPHLAPTHPQSEWVTFADAVEGLVNHGPCDKVRRSREKYFRRLGPGENWKSLPSSLQREALGGAFRSTGGRVGFCRRVAWDRPCPTLVTSPTMPATELVHPVEARPLSVGEYKRVQTFPDEWEVCGPLAAQYRQIGNAVPVLFGRRIGEHLLACASGAAVGSGSRVSRYKETCEKTWLG